MKHATAARIGRMPMGASRLLMRRVAASSTRRCSVVRFEHRQAANMNLDASSDGEVRRGAAAVPDKPVTVQLDQSRLPPPPQLDARLVEHLERLSLVRFSNEDALRHLHTAIRYADELNMVDVEGVEPLVCVLDECCPVRDDVITEPDRRVEVLANAAVTVDEYFVTPPGNVELEKRADRFENVFEEMKRKKRQKQKQTNKK